MPYVDTIEALSGSELAAYLNQLQKVTTLIFFLDIIIIVILIVYSKG